jgi:hypothetical protein
LALKFVSALDAVGIATSAELRSHAALSADEQQPPPDGETADGIRIPFDAEAIVALRQLRQGRRQ